jgi:hypothetical protein
MGKRRDIAGDYWTSIGRPDFRCALDLRYNAANATAVRVPVVSTRSKSFHTTSSVVHFKIEETRLEVKLKRLDAAKRHILQVATTECCICYCTVDKQAVTKRRN